MISLRQINSDCYIYGDISAMLSDKIIIALIEKQKALGVTPMIEPFTDHLVSKNDTGKVVSYGLSSYGYDTLLSDEFKIIKSLDPSGNFNQPLDPLNASEEDYISFKATEGFIIIPPQTFVLGRTVETYSIPRNCLVECLGKSTYARLGLYVNVTPLEPGFVGQIVIEMFNATNRPLKVYANQGIAQFVFHTNKFGCKTSYSDRAGKYQNQQGVQIAKV